jgi:hypothetical protein
MIRTGKWTPGATGPGSSPTFAPRALLRRAAPTAEFSMTREPPMSVVQRAAGLVLCFAFAAAAQDAQLDPEKALSGVVKTQRVRVRFRPDSRAEASADRVAALVEDDLNRILKELDFQQFRHVVQLFLYDDLDDLARTTGVQGTGGFSVPLTSHVPHDNDQTRVHELVHVVAEKFGDRGPETRNLFSAEGLANAVLRYVHGVHVDCVAAFYRKRGELPPLAEMLGAQDFYAWMGSRPGFNAYDVAGSFFRFLLDVHGPQKTRRFYVGHPAKDAFGVDLPALEAKWHARLDAVTLRPGTLKLLTERAGGAPPGAAAEAKLDDKILGPAAEWKALDGAALEKGARGAWKGSGAARAVALTGEKSDGDWGVADVAGEKYGDAFLRARLQADASALGVQLRLGNGCQAMILRGQGAFLYRGGECVAHSARAGLGDAPVEFALRRLKGKATVWIDGKLVLEAEVGSDPAPFGVGSAGGPAEASKLAVRKL